MNTHCFYRILCINQGGIFAFSNCCLVVLVSCLWTATPVLAMGLGDISSSSPLGRPLMATIEVTSDPDQYTASELRVRQLSAKQAKSLGIELAGAYKSYILELVERDGRLVIELRSRKPVNEPFLNFLVELTWVTGKVYREYTLLLDPVTLVSPSASTNDRKRKKPAARAAPAESSSLSPSDDSYRVRAGDSLSKIAARLVKGSKTPRRNMMQWLVQKNPQAFINGDMNRLKSGAQLSLPGGDGVNSVNLAKPSRQAAQSNTAVVDKPSSGKGVDKGPSVEAASSRDDTVERLSIVTARVDKQNSRAEATEAERVIELQGQVAATNDIVERLRRENQSMRERMLAIEKSDYVTSLERLILLKEDEVNELRVKLDSRDEEQKTAIADAQEKPTKAEKTPMISDGASQRLWMLGLLILALVGAIYFFYRWRNREQLKNYDQADSRSDDKGLLDELDKIIASRSAVESAAAAGSKAHANDATMSAGPFDTYIQAGPADDGSRANADNKAGPRRSDETVKQSILEKTLAYSPPEMEEFDLELPEQYQVDDVISDAISAANRGAFDIAEALLRAEQIAQANNEGPSDPKVGSRLGVTLQYIAKLREADGNK